MVAIVIQVDYIRVDYDELDEVAIKFGRLAEDSYELFLKVRRAEDALRYEGWTGREASRFYDEVEESVLPALRRLVEALEGARAISCQIKEQMEAAEREAIASFR